MKRTLDTITAADFRERPAWEWDLDADDDQSLISIDHYPISTLGNRIIGVDCALANGTRVFCVLGNVDLQNQERTDLFVDLSVWLDDGRVHLLRYFDAGYADHGPDHLAARLGLDVAQVFPIRWDLPPYAVSPVGSNRGVITREPRQRRSAAEIMKMVLGWGCWRVGGMFPRWAAGNGSVQAMDLPA